MKQQILHPKLSTEHKIPVVKGKLGVKVGVKVSVLCFVL